MGQAAAMSDALEVWRRRSDEEVIAAARRLEDYLEEGRAIIRAEMRRRRLIVPHAEFHFYLINSRDFGRIDIVSVLSEDIVFRHGSVIEAIVGRLRQRLDEGGTLTPDNFDANPLFADVLHDVIARHASSDPGLINEAKRIGSGKVYVIDGRAPSDGYTPAADIIGSFVVEAGTVVAGSYARNPNHAVISELGFFRLSSALHEQLVAELAQRRLPGKSQ